MSGVPIKREDIKAGDRVRLTFTALIDYVRPTASGEEWELIERPVALPDVPGYYLDNENEVWHLTPSSPKGYLLPEYAPFTLLRPVAEVAAEVLKDLSLSKEPIGDGYCSRIYSTDELRTIRTKFGVES